MFIFILFMLADLSVRGETLVFPSRKISTLKSYMHERIDKGRGLPIKLFLLVFSYWANLYVLAAHIIKLNVAGGSSTLLY